MKTIALTLLCLTFGGVSLAYAAPNCNSSFCGANGGGSQCEIDGGTYTCGECLGGNTTVLYSGDLTAADANEACACQHDASHNCSRMAAPAHEAEQLSPVLSPVEPGEGDERPTPRPRETERPATTSLEFLACL